MLRVTGLVAAVALLALAGIAIAEPVAGTVQSYDESSRMLTLDDGNAFKLLETVDAAALQPGVRVTLNVETLNGEMVVDQVSAE